MLILWNFVQVKTSQKALSFSADVSLNEVYLGEVKKPYEILEENDLEGSCY